jgi:hypothetical protein
MKNSLSILMGLVVLLLTTNLNAAGPDREREKPEDFIKRTQTYKPADRIEAINERLKAAKDEAEKRYLTEQRDKAQKEIDFFAGVNRVAEQARSAGASPSAPSNKNPSADVPNSTEEESRQDRTHDAILSIDNRSARTVVGSPTTEQLVKELSDLYEIQKDPNSKALLSRTAQEINKSGSKEAKEGLNKLLAEILKAKGDPEALLKGINELTKKAELNAEETLEIMRATCPDRCVANKGACRIASQLMKQLATVAAGVTLTAFTVSNIEFGKRDSNGNQDLTLTLNSIKDPKGPKKELKFKIEDKEQPEERFPATPQGTNG